MSVSRCKVIDHFGLKNVAGVDDGNRNVELLTQPVGNGGGFFGRIGIAGRGAWFTGVGVAVPLLFLWLYL